MYKLLSITLLCVMSFVVDAVQQGTIGTITISGTIFVEQPCHSFVTQEAISVECIKNTQTTHAKKRLYPLPRGATTYFAKDISAFITSNDLNKDHKVVMITYH